MAKCMMDKVVNEAFYNPFIIKTLSSVIAQKGMKLIPLCPRLLNK